MIVRRLARCTEPAVTNDLVSLLIVLAGIVAAYYALKVGAWITGYVFAFVGVALVRLGATLVELGEFKRK